MQCSIASALQYRRLTLNCITFAEFLSSLAIRKISEGIHDKIIVYESMPYLFKIIRVEYDQQDGKTKKRGFSNISIKV